MEPVASMHGSIEYVLVMIAEREILTQREKHHSYDLRFKLRAVAEAKKEHNNCCARVGDQ